MHVSPHPSPWLDSVSWAEKTPQERRERLSLNEREVEQEIREKVISEWYGKGELVPFDKEEYRRTRTEEIAKKLQEELETLTATDQRRANEIFEEMAEDRILAQVNGEILLKLAEQEKRPQQQEQAIQQEVQKRMEEVRKRVLEDRKEKLAEENKRAVEELKKNPLASFHSPQELEHEPPLDKTWSWFSKKTLPEQLYELLDAECQEVCEARARTKESKKVLSGRESSHSKNLLKAAWVIGSLALAALGIAFTMINPFGIFALGPIAIAMGTLLFLGKSIGFCRSSCEKGSGLAYYRHKKERQTEVQIALSEMRNLLNRNGHLSDDVIEPHLEAIKAFVKKSRKYRQKKPGAFYRWFNDWKPLEQSELISAKDTILNDLKKIFPDPKLLEENENKGWYVLLNHALVNEEDEHSFFNVLPPEVRGEIVKNLWAASNIDNDAYTKLGSSDPTAAAKISITRKDRVSPDVEEARPFILEAPLPGRDDASRNKGLKLTFSERATQILRDAPYDLKLQLILQQKPEILQEKPEARLAYLDSLCFNLKDFTEDKYDALVQQLSQLDQKNINNNYLTLQTHIEAVRQLNEPERLSYLLNNVKQGKISKTLFRAINLALAEGLEILTIHDFDAVWKKAELELSSNLVSYEDFAEKLNRVVENSDLLSELSLIEQFAVCLTLPYPWLSAAEYRRIAAELKNRDGLEKEMKLEGRWQTLLKIRSTSATAYFKKLRQNKKISKKEYRILMEASYRIGAPKAYLIWLLKKNKITKEECSELDRRLEIEKEASYYIGKQLYHSSQEEQEEFFRDLNEKIAEEVRKKVAPYVAADPVQYSDPLKKWGGLLNNPFPLPPPFEKSGGLPDNSPDAEEFFSDEDSL